MTLDLDTVLVKAAGLAGALVSMKFLQGTWPARFTTALCGALMSFYAAPYMSGRIGIPEGLGGFLLGMFGMAIASRVWEWLQATPVAAFWQIILDWMKRKAGV